MMSAAFLIVALSEPRFATYVLGTAQDGGFPQLGCEATCCTLARSDPSVARLRTALGVVDRETRKLVLIEATSDIERQVSELHRLAPATDRGRNPVDAVLVTHAHAGHYLGLMSFGKETAASRAMPLYCTARFAAFLESSPPLHLLITDQHLMPHVITPGVAFEPIPGLRAEAIQVPHRDEFSDTVAFVLRGPAKSLLFVPDIDKWEKWDRAIEQVVDSVDYALLDATFFAADELPGRSIEKIPHPLVPETMARLATVAQKSPGKIALIHLNHTNVLLRDGDARERLERQGFHVANPGDRFDL
ncbi:MAG: MBL fold metallo-hydrolase [Planctomycetota bacterium]